MFWQSIRGLRKGRQGFFQAVLCMGEELVTGDTVRLWTENFWNLLKLVRKSSVKEAESEDSREAMFSSLL